MTTSTISIKVLEDHNKIAFAQLFTRFTCEVGYRRLMLIDEGEKVNW